MTALARDHQIDINISHQSLHACFFTVVFSRVEACRPALMKDDFLIKANIYTQQSVRATKGLHSIGLRLCGPLFWNNLSLKLTGVSTIYLFNFKTNRKHFSKIQLHKCRPTRSLLVACRPTLLFLFTVVFFQYTVGLLIIRLYESYVSCSGYWGVI